MPRFDLRRLALAMVVFLVMPPHTGRPATTFQNTAIQIVPGSRVMSTEEKALAPDPAKGAQHGIILVDEMVRDESKGTESEVIHHVRAKIFSNEARSLGDVELDYDRERGLLKKWWAATLLPDGTVLDLKQGDLQEQELVRTRGDRYVILKASLPGVVPGCIIDYGYHYQERGFYDSMRIDIQRDSPVREFRYRWVPYPGEAAAFRVSRAEGLPVSVTRDGKSVLVTGKDLPAVLDEPYMPPERESHASVTFYYRASGSKPADFWELESKRLLRRARAFAKEKPTAQLVASMNLPAGGDLMARLRAAYVHASASFRNTSRRMAEEAEAANPDEEEKPEQWRNVVDLLSSREGSGRELDFLFFGIARALGAEANLVLATDRRERYFDPGLLSTEQFDWTLVAVKPPGAPDEKLVFVDLGSGLQFGEIPWWLTASRAFMATPSGHQVVLLYPSNPAKNLMQTRAKISFNLQEGTASVRWTSDGSGQQGLSERWRLRDLDAERRQEEMERYCGASGNLEVVRAEAPKLQDLTASYHLECEGTLMNINLHEGLDGYRFGISGPYIEPAPRFTAPTRTQSAIFPYPSVESLALDVVTPEGFAPIGVPPVPPVESPFGRYALFISTTPEGYHVERMYALTATVVPPGEYDAMKRFFAAVAMADDTPLRFKRTGVP